MGGRWLAETDSFCWDHSDVTIFAPYFFFQSHTAVTLVLSEWRVAIRALDVCSAVRVLAHATDKGL
jgi:hypothetical protein